MNQQYLERKLKVIPPLPCKARINNKVLVATMADNIKYLGYTFEPKLFAALCRVREEDLVKFYNEIIPILKKMKGAHVKYNPMYPGFPKQVMEASEVELILNALMHYWTATLSDFGVIGMEDIFLPNYTAPQTVPLLEQHKLELIKLGDFKDYFNIFTQLAAAKSSISENDKAFIKECIELYTAPSLEFLPKEISFKEQLVFIVGCYLGIGLGDKVIGLIKNATDVLRLAAFLSGGDISLAEKTKFRNFKRSERRFLLRLLNAQSQLAENLALHKNPWLRLAEKLHPGEYQSSYPEAYQAFYELRNGIAKTFNARIESLFTYKDYDSLLPLLSSRPGYFARRLDELICKFPECGEKIVSTFLKQAENVSFPVLLQVYNHFNIRNTQAFRPVFPKGSTANVQLLPIKVGVSDAVSQNLAKKLRSKLVKLTSQKEKLGKVYIDPLLKDYIVPFSQRSASKALKTITRGSQIPLDNKNIIRFFLWWKEPESVRTDIDLSAVFLDQYFNQKSNISFRNLRSDVSCHSGDITSAPVGACEFIDVDINKAIAHGYRYVVMSINSFTQQPYKDLPECFAGFMSRDEMAWGEIFEPKTVKNKFDLTADSNQAVPLIIDIVGRKVIWADISSKSFTWLNDVQSNASSINNTVKAICHIGKPNLYDLLSIHAKGRGKLVDTPNKADKVYDVDFAYDIPEILSQYL